ncbi:hypothetical protein GUJ93_ZPchr0003g17015 [Zizania palustris]|uniref:Uncharacterized protein n=1 Tax=Zizania palustris TaxID=103762 RepID=A0A8J5VJB2_ZIZPA|nr:hypothetical protein GUJ93_ZPchr0003g17015 [Zizania palustris]
MPPHQPLGWLSRRHHGLTGNEWTGAWRCARVSGACLGFTFSLPVDPQMNSRTPWVVLEQNKVDNEGGEKDENGEGSSRGKFQGMIGNTEKNNITGDPYTLDA